MLRFANLHRFFYSTMGIEGVEDVNVPHTVIFRKCDDELSINLI